MPFQNDIQKRVKSLTLMFTKYSQVQNDCVKKLVKSISCMQMTELYLNSGYLAMSLHSPTLGPTLDHSTPVH